ncbi:uncharacterized protein LOC141951436 [Strix uralensis]|uniref:uncharacterized protein LOC141951436 n=1 Tax=Strix uralensis TaxID=36305 RepID=UPI003DA7827B
MATVAASPASPAGSGWGATATPASVRGRTQTEKERGESRERREERASDSDRERQREGARAGGGRPLPGAAPSGTGVEAPCGGGDRRAVPLLHVRAEVAGTRMPGPPGPDMPIAEKRTEALRPGPEAGEEAEPLQQVEVEPGTCDNASPWELLRDKYQGNAPQKASGSDRQALTVHTKATTTTPPDSAPQPSGKSSKEEGLGQVTSGSSKKKGQKHHHGADDSPGALAAKDKDEVFEPPKKKKKMNHLPQESSVPLAEKAAVDKCPGSGGNGLGCQLLESRPKQQVSEPRSHLGMDPTSFLKKRKRRMEEAGECCSRTLSSGSSREAELEPPSTKRQRTVVPEAGQSDQRKRKWREILSSPSLELPAASKFCATDSSRGTARDRLGRAGDDCGAGAAPGKLAVSSVVEELLRESLDKAYGKQVLAWYGGASPSARMPFGMRHGPGARPSLTSGTRSLTEGR